MPTARWDDKTKKQKRQAYEAVKRWRAKNSERFNMEARQAIRMRRSWQHATAWPLICEHYGDACVNCGSEDGLCFDHVRPLSMAGLNQLWNGQPLCKRCNTCKGQLQDSAPDWRPDQGRWIRELVELNPQLMLEDEGRVGWHLSQEGREELAARAERRAKELVIPGQIAQ